MSQSPPAFSSRQRNQVWGFTLLELLIVVSITALLSSYAILYTATGRQQVALYVEASKITQTVLKSKSLAIATYANPAAPVCGYGVRVDSGASAYALFSYNAPDCSSIPSIDFADASKYTELERFSLAPGLAFQTGSTPLDAVLFVPPDPETLLWSGGTPLQSGSGFISIQTRDGLASVRVGVSTAGQVTF